MERVFGGQNERLIKHKEQQKLSHRIKVRKKQT